MTLFLLWVGSVLLASMVVVTSDLLDPATSVFEVAVESEVSAIDFEMAKFSSIS